MIDFKIEGGDATVRYLRTVSPVIQSEIDRTMRELAVKLTAKVKAEKLSGQVLRNRTGRLRRSINFRMAGEGSAHVVATVGTNLEYGRIHELGGAVTIKEHLRMVRQAWGRPIAPRQVLVRTHTAHFPERSFLRSALAELEPVIRAELAAAVNRGAVK